ncbi:hypothetical protein ACLOJK_014100 [Asimina triloba]
MNYGRPLLPQQAEISLCRVYKRTGVEDHCPVPNPRSSRPSSSKWPPRSNRRHSTDVQPTTSATSRDYSFLGGRLHQVGSSSSSSGLANEDGIGLELSRHGAFGSTDSTSTEDDISLLHSKEGSSLLATCTLFPPSPMPLPPGVDELNKVVDYQHIYGHHPSQIPPPSSSQPPLLSLSNLPNNMSTVSDKLWEWNPVPDANRDYNIMMKARLESLVQGEKLLELQKLLIVTIFYFGRWGQAEYPSPVVKEIFSSEF